MTEKPKKVLFVITKSNWGGAQRYVFDLAVSLPKETYAVSVAAGGQGPLMEKLRAAYIPTTSIPALGRDVHALQDLYAFFTLYRMFVSTQPDIVHLNSSKVGAMGALAGRLAGVPQIIFTAHGWPTRERRNPLSRMGITFLSWFTIMLSHQVICVSQKDADEAAQWPSTSKKLRTIHNGIATATTLTRREARERLNLPEEAFVVGTIGEMTPNKNYTGLITAAALLKEQHSFIFDCIGDGEERSRIAQAIIDSRTHEICKLEGFVQDAAQYLNAYDAFVLFSYKEGLPYVLLEAGAAGLPVVASNTGGISEIITHNTSGLLVTPGDTTALATALSQLVEDSTLRKRLGDALQHTITEAFSLSRMVEKTLAVYSQTRDRTRR